MLHLLTGISNANSVLLQKEDIHKSLQDLVTVLGEATEVDRCYIFTNKQENDTLKLYYTHEWCKPGVQIQLGNPDLSGISYDLFPGLYDALSNQKAFYGLVKDAVNPLFKEIMEQQDIKAFLFTPIFCDNIFWGWMGYDDCKNEHIWQQEEVEALYTVSKNIGLRLLREKIEQKFNTAQERFNLTVSASQQGIWEWDIIKGKINYSKKFMELLVYQHYEFEHTFENWSSRVHRDDIDGVLQSLQDYLNKKRADHSIEFRMMHKKGHYVWLRGSGTALWDENGKAVFIAGSHLDISKLKDQQNDIETQRNEFDYLINNLAEVVFRLNSVYEFTFLNDYWLITSNYTKEESIFKKITDYLHHDDVDTVKQQFQQLINHEKKAINLKVQLLLKSGGTKWVQIIATRLKTSSSDQSAIAGSMIDIHDRIETERHEKELAEMKADFIAMASHQFRTPLTVIYTNIELIEIYAENLDHSTGKKLDEVVSRVKNEIDRMTNLMNNIILFGKYNTTELPINLKPHNIVSLITKVIDTYFSNLPDGITPHIIGDKSNVKINIDELLFTYIITNIVSNALKYSPGELNPTILIDFKANCCKIVVKDYGIGIPIEDQPKLFTSFYRASNTQTIQGSGLGLVVAKQFTELHGGTIEINSQINIGTEVILTLPYHNV